jgi:transcriptional regulator with XRE-family HTH domain
MSYKEDILKLRAEGKSYREIEKILGCSRGTISYYLGNKEIKEEKMAELNKFQEKGLTYLENYKIKRPCMGCSQYLHHSQMDIVDNVLDSDILNPINDVETLEDAKRKIAQLKFLCSNCNRLRMFRESNKGK